MTTVPKGASAVPHRAGVGASLSRDDVLRARVPHAVLLSNGAMASLVSDSGGGYTMHGALALTRWTADRTRDADGHWLYLSEDDGGSCWSAGAQPIATPPGKYSASLAPGIVTITREDHGIETRSEIVVAPDAPVEVRRYTVTNRSKRPRALKLTTYLELVLNSPAADASHPAFSKLFVQTDHRVDDDLLLAWRRLRSPEDEKLSVAYRFLVEGASTAFEHETDRARFLGRTRGPDAPAALDPNAHLSGTVGNVLDPIFSFRRTIKLKPGESVRAIAILAAHADENAAATLALRFSAPAQVDETIRAARERGERVVADTGLTPRWPEVTSLIGGAAYTGIPFALDDRTRLDDHALLGEIAAHSESHRPVHPDLPLTGRDALPKGPRTDKSAAGAMRAGHAQKPRTEPLTLANRYGGFSADGDEYVVRSDARGEAVVPPLPWTNVVANEHVGFVVSEKGAGYTWTINSRENRLTPWYNDPIGDPHGEAWYIRDNDTGEFWSPLPGPSASGSPSETRHGIGYSRWQQTHSGIEHDAWMFVPRTDAVKVLRLQLTNRSGRARSLSAYALYRWMLGANAIESSRTVVTALDLAADTILAINPTRGEFAVRVAFAAVSAPPPANITHTGDGAEFIGRHGTLAAPAALLTGRPLEGRVGGGLDPCAAHRVTLAIPADESAEIIFLLGEGDDATDAASLVARYRDSTAVDAALTDVRAFWNGLKSAVHIETPSPALDLMVNHWLPFQNLSCRIWGRSAFYQSGGAFGFRDQLQDSAAMVYLDPALTRAQIVLHAAHQFVEGDVLHWWHPPLSKGIRTRFSDDLLWLPFVTTFYVRTTGDAAILDERARFLRGPLLEEGEDERFILSTDSGVSGTVYEHCALAIDRSLTAGAHGLPLMGVGDWNDGMNRVGREGRGESVWLGFFLADILYSFIPICDARGDSARASRYRAYRKSLVTALNADGAGWDGNWYRRAYYDDGVPLGSASSDECRIDAIAQAWSVISGVAPADRADRALAAMDEYLVSEKEGLIRLLTPPFDKTPHDPGYIKGYVPGVRENGGQYTHGALWAVRALAEMGRHERAASLLAMLSPVSHGDAKHVEIYRAEPYVIAADVYGVEPHVGRAGWTWYTGSAAWMYRTALESILGFSIDRGQALVLKPCIPDAWPGFKLRYRAPDGATTYDIQVTRAKEGSPTTVRETGGRAKSEDANPRVEDASIQIPLAADGTTHTIIITLGDDLTRRYQERRDV